MEEVKRNEGDLGSDGSLTTEQVINIVAERPSWLMWAVWIGLMSFMAVCVVYDFKITSLLIY